MFQDLFSRRKTKYSLEKKSTESLVLCNSLGLYNLPINGENNLDISKNGELILASNRSNLCLIKTKSHLYNPILRQSSRSRNDVCCCNASSIKKPSTSCDQVVSKKLKYKTKCTSSLWYSSDSSIFLTSGDCSIDVWDSSVPEIKYSFSNLPSTVNCLSIAKCDSVSPMIAGGLSCSSVAMCDTRYGTSTNFCRPKFSAPVSVVQFLKHNENQLVAGYDNSLVLVWDLRMFNRPLHTINNTIPDNTEPLIWSCSVGSGTGSSNLRTLQEKHSVDFSTEDDLWNYIKDHESSNKNEKFHENMIESKPKNLRSGKVGTRLGPMKRRLNLSVDKINDSKLPKRINFDCSGMENKEKTDTSTDIKISDEDFNVYIAHKNGIINCYNYNTFKVLKSIDANHLLNEMKGGIMRRYYQKMKIELICRDSFVIFNHLDSVVMINLRKGTIQKYIKLKFEDDLSSWSETPLESQTSNSETVTGTQMRARTNHSRESQIVRYSTSIATLPSIREVYVTNDNGQMFVLHPDFKMLFGQS